jgi:hypothetical protein
LLHPEQSPEVVHVAPNLDTSHSERRGGRCSAEFYSAVSPIFNQLCSAFTLLWDGLSEEWVAPGHFRGGAQICDVFVTQS